MNPFSFDPYTAHGYESEPDPEQESLQSIIAICQIGFCFALGVLMALVARLFPPAAFFYWLSIVMLLIGLGVGFAASRSLRYFFLFLAALASVLAGHWDAIAGWMGG
ncbi:MAG: hypothetical protein LH702_06270 [Phormidesmis sp. CAN_BIN44]|nr:hypothetical protein [Phormidesmis sp. CAN_BIN44]